MNKVTTVNLNGRACQMEERAYEALRVYLDEAARLLAEDPDITEIMADLEQAIADKGSRFLGGSKNVITEDEMARILKEMGPVEPGADEASGTAGAAAPGAASGGARAASAPASAPRRLYQINEGAWLAGVCNGLAAYFGVDPTLVRLLFIVMLFVSGGFWIIVYLVLMFVLPTAKTPEARAPARGLPFNAQELVEQTKRHYADLKEGHQRWRDRRRRDKEREFWRAKQAAGYEPPHSRPFPEPQPGYGARVAAGFVLPVIGVVSAVLTVIWVIALVSLLTTGEILGWRLPLDIPNWIGVLALIAGYAIINVPLRAMRYASYRSVGEYRGWFVLWDGVLWLALVILGWWVATRYVPGVDELMHDLLHDWRDMTIHLGHMLGDAARMLG
jgi:phage shock protein PspC (stress-responsive transcriptional regulator)